MGLLWVFFNAVTGGVHHWGKRWRVNANAALQIQLKCKFGECVNWYYDVSLLRNSAKVRKLSCRSVQLLPCSYLSVQTAAVVTTASGGWRSEGLLPQKFPSALFRGVTQTDKSGQILYVTEIHSSLWFSNLSPTNQKGNLRCDPINPLPPLHFSCFFIQASLHISWNFSWPDSVVCTWWTGCFSSVLLPCLFMFKGQKGALLECQRGNKIYIWDEGTLIYKSQMAPTSCIGWLTRLCSFVQVQEDDLRRRVKDQRTDSLTVSAQLIEGFRSTQ